MKLAYIVDGVISAHDKEIKFHSFVSTSGDKHVLWPSATAIFVSILRTTFASFQFIESVSVGKGNAGFCSIAVNDVLARSH